MKELVKIAPDTLLEEPLAAHCTMRVGGPCRALVRPANPEELRQVISYLHKSSVPFKVVGKGANLLISDAGYDGVIIILGDGFNWLERKDTTVFSVGAGLSLAKFAHQLSRLDIGGFEFAAQIPGTVGGALVNNAGAYGQDWTNRVIDATVVRGDGTQETLSRDELKLAYRSSMMKGTAGIVVVGGTFAGEVRPCEEIQSTIAKYGKQRAASQPVAEPSAGCIFKNPSAKHPGCGSAGHLIETAGLKGSTLGRAQVSTKHANFIVNLGKATAQEVRDLIRKVQDQVYDKFSVEMETEVEFVG